MPTKGWTCPLRVSIAMRMTCSGWPVGPRRMTDVEWIGPSLRRDSKPRVTSRHTDTGQSVNDCYFQPLGFGVVCDILLL